MDNKKLQEFLKKVEAQSAVARTSALDEINADNGIQTMSETGLEEGLEVRYSEGNADIIANKFTDNGSIISTEAFYEQMKYLKDNGYKTLFWKDACEYLEQGKPLPAKSVVIRFLNIEFYLK